MNGFPKILTDEKSNEQNIDFRNALFSLDRTFIDKENVKYLIEIYYNTTLSEIRNKILKLLYDFDFIELKEFFAKAYKRERYLDMKIYALRGLSQFLSEKDIDTLLQKFNSILAKRQITTPYNYQEYEFLRGQNALPYLIERYNYKCFRQTLEQVNQQYSAMPEAFKGHFTTDKNGEIIVLRTPDESKQVLNDFFEKNISANNTATS